MSKMATCGNDKRFVAPKDVSSPPPIPTKAQTSRWLCYFVRVQLVPVNSELMNHQDQVQGADIMRIRINSQAVLGHLTSLLGETEKRSTPRTFVRPFKPMIYYQQKMKDILGDLEEKWADVEGLEGEGEDSTSSETPEELEFVVEPSVEPRKAAAQGEETDGSASDDDEAYDDDDRESLQSVDSNTEDQEIMMDGVQALRDMRCYVNFVENEVMPLYRQYDGTSATQVRYEDLWSLFRVGDLIYMPASNDNNGRYHELWRVYRVKSPRPESQLLSATTND
jgi:hypothetical protein